MEPRRKVQEVFVTDQPAASSQHTEYKNSNTSRTILFYLFVLIWIVLVMLWRLDVITVHAIWPEPVWNINVFTSLPSSLLQIRAQSAEKLSECLSKSGQTDNTVTTRAIKKSHNSNYTSIVSQIVVFSCPKPIYLQVGDQ